MTIKKQEVYKGKDQHDTQHFQNAFYTNSIMRDKTQLHSNVQKLEV